MPGCAQIGMKIPHGDTRQVFPFTSILHAILKRKLKIIINLLRILLYSFTLFAIMDKKQVTFNSSIAFFRIGGYTIWMVTQGSLTL